MAKNKDLPITNALLALKGDQRTFSDLAKAAGVSAPAITRMCSGGYHPSPMTLKKLVSNAARPCNGVTFEDLLVAAGYSDSYSEPKSINESISETIPDEPKPTKAHLRKQLMGAIVESISAISNTFVKCIDVSKIKPDRVGRFRPDLAVCVPVKRGELEWWFDLQPIDASDMSEAICRLRYIIGNYIFVKLKPNQKLSLVLFDEDLFGAAASFKDSLSYNGELSLILVDKDELVIRKECLLSHTSTRRSSFQIATMGDKETF